MHAIFLTFDENHFHYAKSCINSIKANYPEHPDILVSYTGNSESIFYFLNKIDNLKIIKLKENYDYRLGIIPSNIIYRRFNLWTDQFDCYQNILHLDADTIILSPLDEIFLTDDFYIISDHSKTAKIFPSLNDNLVAQLRLDGIKINGDADEMGNAGVFLIPKKYRTADHHSKLTYLAEKYQNLVSYADQSIISLWCNLYNIPINKCYENNCQIRFLFEDDIILNIKNIRILHYSGEAKNRIKDPNTNNPDENFEFYRLANVIRFFYRKERLESEKCLTELEAITIKYLKLLNATSSTPI